MIKPVRTCIGCRSRAENSLLLRIVVRGSEILADEAGVFPGRGAWLHPTEQCYSFAVKRSAFGRALRTDVVLDVAQLDAVIKNKLNGIVNN